MFTRLVDRSQTSFNQTNQEPILSSLKYFKFHKLNELSNAFLELAWFESLSFNEKGFNLGLFDLQSHLNSGGAIF